MKKILALALVVCMASVLMAGCSKDKGASSPQSGKAKVMKVTSVNQKDRALSIGICRNC